MKKSQDTSAKQLSDLSEKERQLQSVLSKHLDAEADHLDFTITSKLSAARHKALALGQIV